MSGFQMENYFSYWSQLTSQIGCKWRYTGDRCRGTKLLDRLSDRLLWSTLIDPLPIPCDFAFLFGRKRSFLLIATKVTHRERERESEEEMEWRQCGGGDLSWHRCSSY